VLVMHGFDVRRAVAQFEAAGLQVMPAPTHVPTWESLDLADFLPNVGALYTSHFALYEALALARDAVQCLTSDAASCRVLPGLSEN
jgi:uncharacterized SAM-binding protein YcdF (DUF218 family)